MLNRGELPNEMRMCVVMLKTGHVAKQFRKERFKSVRGSVLEGKFGKPREKFAQLNAGVPSKGEN